MGQSQKLNSTFVAEKRERSPGFESSLDSFLANDSENASSSENSGPEEDEDGPSGSKIIDQSESEDDFSLEDDAGKKGKKRATVIDSDDDSDMATGHDTHSSKSKSQSRSCPPSPAPITSPSTAGPSTRASQRSTRNTRSSTKQDKTGIQGNQDKTPADIQPLPVQRKAHSSQPRRFRRTLPELIDSDESPPNANSQPAAPADDDDDSDIESLNLGKRPHRSVSPLEVVESPTDVGRCTSFKRLKRHAQSPQASTTPPRSSQARTSSRRISTPLHSPEKIREAARRNLIGDNSIDVDDLLRKGLTFKGIQVKASLRGTCRKCAAPIELGDLVSAKTNPRAFRSPKRTPEPSERPRQASKRPSSAYDFDAIMATVLKASAKRQAYLERNPSYNAAGAAFEGYKWAHIRCLRGSCYWTLPHGFDPESCTADLLDSDSDGLPEEPLDDDDLKADFIVPDAPATCTNATSVDTLGLEDEVPDSDIQERPRPQRGTDRRTHLLGSDDEEEGKRSGGASRIHGAHGVVTISSSGDEDDGSTSDNDEDEDRGNSEEGRTPITHHEVGEVFSQAWQHIDWEGRYKVDMTERDRLVQVTRDQARSDLSVSFDSYCEFLMLCIVDRDYSRQLLSGGDDKDFAALCVFDAGVSAIETRLSSARSYALSMCWISAKAGFLNDALHKPYLEQWKVSRSEVQHLAASESKYYPARRHTEMQSLVKTIDREATELDDWSAPTKTCSVCSRNESWNRVVVRFNGPVVPREWRMTHEHGAYALHSQAEGDKYQRLPPACTEEDDTIDSDLQMLEYEEERCWLIGKTCGRRLRFCHMLTHFKYRLCWRLRAIIHKYKERLPQEDYQDVVGIIVKEHKKEIDSLFLAFQSLEATCTEFQQQSGRATTSGRTDAATDRDLNDVDRRLGHPDDSL